MREIVDTVLRWEAEGTPAAVATVIATRRSAPRPPGAKMAVNARGEIWGMVSGGCVEGAVVEVCERVIAGEAPQLLQFGIADAEAWEVGLPCGGEIEVWVQRHAASRFDELAHAGGRATEVTVLAGPHTGAKLLVEADGTRRGTLGEAELDEEAAGIAGEIMWLERSERRGDLFFDAVYPAPRLILVGAVDIAAALCTLARHAGWRPYVIDPRPRFATQERFPDAEAVIAAWPESGIAQLGGIDAATSIVVLTHDPKVDDAALHVALRSPARFIGGMGSRRAQEARRERLHEAGFGDADIARLSAPVGLDLGATSPQETALSMLAEVVARRHGRSGGRLAHASGRIHEIAA